MICYIKSTEWKLFLSADGRGQEQCCLESPERSVGFHNPYFSLKDSVFGIIYQSQWGGGTYTHTNTQVWYSPCWAHPLGVEERERQKEKEGLGIDVSLDNNNNNSIASQGHAEKSSQGAIKIHPLYWAPWTSRPSGLQSIRASRPLKSVSNLPDQLNTPSFSLSVFHFVFLRATFAPSLSCNALFNFRGIVFTRYVHMGRCRDESLLPN